MEIKNRNLFRVTRFILLKIPWLFQFFAKFRSQKKHLLIIKADAIGDYILFRNYIEILRQSERYKGYRIDLLGNIVWQEMALAYDASFINNFYFINANSLYYDPVKTIKLGWLLFKNNYEIVLQPSFTRVLFTDGLAALTAAKQMIGFQSDDEGIAAKYKVKTDKFYTLKLNLPEHNYFEFDRSRFFFENVLNVSIDLNALFIAEDKADRKGIFIFPGSGDLKRSWEPEKFLQLIKLLSQTTLEPLYLAGGATEVLLGNYLTQNLPPQTVTNLIGKTSLPQLTRLFANAALVITSETSAAHIAAATQTKVVCILGGGHFNRFLPYPHLMQHKPVCVYQKLPCYHCNWNCIYTINEKEPYPCVSNISVLSVWQAVLPLLPGGVIN